MRKLELVGVGIDVAEDQEIGGGGGAVLVEEGEVPPGGVVGEVPGLRRLRFGRVLGGQLPGRVGDPLGSVEVLQVQGEREQGGQVAGGGAVVQGRLDLPPVDGDAHVHRGTPV